MRASHILVKHEESRRCASWKDPEGKAIMARSKAQAVETLQGFLARINAAADKGGCCAPAGGGGGGATRARPPNPAGPSSESQHTHLTGAAAEFAAIARTESDCGSAAQGGDLNEFGQGDMQKVGAPLHPSRLRCTDPRAPPRALRTACSRSRWGR